MLPYPLEHALLRALVSLICTKTYLVFLPQLGSVQPNSYRTPYSRRTFLKSTELSLSPYSLKVFQCFSLPLREGHQTSMAFLVSSSATLFSHVSHYSARIALLCGFSKFTASHACQVSQVHLPGILCSGLFHLVNLIYAV